MGFWKVLGGVAAGVGAVVALPVAGPVGVVTAVGAAVGAAVGGTAGAVASSLDEEEKESARRDGERSATAQYEVKVQKLENALKEALDRLEGDKSYFQLIIALFAVGMATAYADGKVTDDELEELNEFVGGIANSKYPPHVKDTITKLRNNPPNFSTAMKYVCKLGNDIDMRMFEYVIELVAMADGTFARDEKALLEAFKREMA